MTSRPPRYLALLRLIGVAAAAFALAGCTKPLLSPTDQRTPFDRYDAVRNQYATQQVEDEYGAKKPNLKARLMPKH